MSTITTKRIRDLAKEQGRSLKYLCDKIGVSSRTYFRDIEKQQREIPPKKLEIIAGALNTTVDYLLGNTDEKLCITSKDQIVSLLEGLPLDVLLEINAEIQQIIKNRE